MKADIYTQTTDEPTAVKDIAVIWSIHNNELPIFTKCGRYFLGTITPDELNDNYKRIKTGEIV